MAVSIRALLESGTCKAGGRLADYSSRKQLDVSVMYRDDAFSGESIAYFDINGRSGTHFAMGFISVTPDTMARFVQFCIAHDIEIRE